LPRPALAQPSPRQTRLAGAAALAERRARIFVRMQQGWSYEAIAEAEALSCERIRQIIREALDGRGGEANPDHRRLQLARLDPALRLAGEKVAAGDLKAIDRLIRVLNQMDKYRPAGAGFRVGSSEEEYDARQRILDKLSDVDARRGALEDWSPPRADQRDMSEEEAGRAAEEEARKSEVSKFFPRQVVDFSRNGKI
jgi:hypothetical protein